MPFSEIIGQERPIRILQSAIQCGDISHAYLFSGPEGIGKKLTAFAFAKTLNCLSLEGDSCGNCLNCKKFENGNFPDFFLIEPVDGHIKIEVIRELKKKISFRPYEGKFKIVAINGIEEMTSGAANSFLKTLEEPTVATIFILICHNFSMLLPTIISRCQRIQFNLIPLEIIKNILVNNLQVNPEDAFLSASYSQGCLGKAIKMEIGEFQKKRHEVLDFINELSFDKIDSLFKKNKEWSSSNKNVEIILITVLNIARDVAILKASGNQKLITNLDAMDQLTPIAKRLNINQSILLFNYVEEAIRNIKKNINVQLSLDLLFIKICSVLQRGIYAK